MLFISAICFERKDDDLWLLLFSVWNIFLWQQFKLACFAPCPPSRVDRKEEKIQRSYLSASKHAVVLRVLKGYLELACNHVHCPQNVFETLISVGSSQNSRSSSSSRRVLLEVLLQRKVYLNVWQSNLKDETNCICFTFSMASFGNWSLMLSFSIFYLCLANQSDDFSCFVRSSLDWRLNMGDSECT